MNPQLSISPFGQRPLSLAIMASEAAAKACPAEKIVHKWQVYRAICEAKAAIGVSDRALAVLNALLSFHGQTTLQAGDLVVFPSNRELALRAHGMAPATLRRHLAMLVDCSLIVRRDSPNGKRYARKGASGEIERAFGFDLAPLVVRAEEFEALAETARAERRAIAMLKEEVSIYRRDIAKMIAIGLEEGASADWMDFHGRLRDLTRSSTRALDRTELESRSAGLAVLREDLRKILETLVNSQKMSANESQFDRLYLNSKPDSQNESDLASKEAGSESTALQVETAAQPAVYPLMMVMKACPDITDYTRSGIAGWPDLLEAAALVRPMLGISPSAYEEAVRTLGALNAATMVAAILQRSDSIRSPGGYLRSLTRKAERGRFSLGSVLMALLRMPPPSGGG